MPNMNEDDTPESQELMLLRKIDSRLDMLDAKIERTQEQAIKYGASAGATTGAISGGIIAIGLMLARAKLGL
jgi:tetrahydromethanopterin S-methyltransferase subunit G